MNKQITIVVKNVGEKAKAITVNKDTAEPLRQIVGDLKTTPFETKGLILVCNETDKPDSVPPNIYLGRLMISSCFIFCHGNCIISKFDGVDDFESLNESEIEFAIDSLNKEPKRRRKRLIKSEDKLSEDELE